jgi:hypothetical protein
MISPKEGRNQVLAGWLQLAKQQDPYLRPREQALLANEKGLSIAPVSWITWSNFKIKKWRTPFWNP